MRKSHLNLLALTAGLPEGFRIGQGTDTIPDVFVEVACDFARDPPETGQLQKSFWGGIQNRSRKSVAALKRDAATEASKDQLSRDF